VKAQKENVNGKTPTQARMTLCEITTRPGPKHKYKTETETQT